MSIIFFALIPIFSIAGFILFSVNRLRMPFPDAPLFSLSAVIVLMYIFTLFSRARLGVYALFGLNLVFIVDFVILQVCKKGRFALERDAVVGLSFFALAVILLTLISKRWFFHCWDEYMHWDPFVRQIYKTDGFYASGSWFKNPNYKIGRAIGRAHV